MRSLLILTALITVAASPIAFQASRADAQEKLNVIELINEMCNEYPGARERTACLKYGNDSRQQGEPVSLVIRWGCGSQGEAEHLINCYKTAADYTGNTDFKRGTSGCLKQHECVWARFGCMEQYFKEYPSNAR